MCASGLANCLMEAIYRFKELPYTIHIRINSDYTINKYYTAVSIIVDWQGYFERNLTKPVGMKQKLLSTEKQYA
jgi:GDP-L-fucose synthase